METPVLERPQPAAVPETIGDEIHALAADIYPICRSITGRGVRETLDALSRHIPLTRHRVTTAVTSSGTSVSAVAPDRYTCGSCGWTARESCPGQPR